MSRGVDSFSSPVEWLDRLSGHLKETRCRREGRDLPLDEALRSFQRLLVDIRAANARVWWVGNGGSSAIASHLSQDLLNKLSIKSQVLSCSSLLTCMANDYGYNQVYARPLRVLAEPGDLLIAISSSGRSENILNSAQQALERKMKLVTLSGFSNDNPLSRLPADLSFFLPGSHYGLVELGHEALLHSAIETLCLAEGK